VALAGGNVTRARDLSITVTVLGSVPRGRALTRAGARAGDRLFVSGALGEAALGLRAGADRKAVARQRRPEPRLALGRALSRVATACLDVSDGLVQDLGHLCRASGVGAEVRLDRLPARSLPDALAGGEDYELLFTVPPSRLGALARATRGAGVPVTDIGEVVARRGVRVLDGAGRPYRVRRAGHDHLR